MTTDTAADVLFESDLKAALAARAAVGVPASLYQSVAGLQSGDHSSRRHVTEVARPRRALRFALSGAFGLLAVALVVVVAVGVLVSFGVRPSVAGAGDRTFRWDTDVASLAADAVEVDVGGRQFSVPADARVISDLGTATYRTLELAWFDEGVEMRLNLYLSANDSRWWISTIRTYDGRVPGDWIYYLAPGLSAERGQSLGVDIDLFGLGLSGVGRLKVRGAVLSAFEPGTGVPAYSSCTMLGPMQGNPFGPRTSQINPPVPGVELRQGMSAAEAEANVRAAGACFQFRYNFPASNLGQVWCVAPPGEIAEWGYGSTGEVILFVEAGPRQTIPPDQPRVMHCT